MENLAARQRGEVWHRDGVLRFRPRRHFRLVDLFHPAEGVGDARAVVVGDRVHLAGSRILDFGLLLLRGRDGCGEREHDQGADAVHC